MYLISMHVRYFCARYWKTSLECDARCGGLAGCRYKPELNSCSDFFSLTASMILLEAWGRLAAEENGEGREKTPEVEDFNIRTSLLQADAKFFKLPYAFTSSLWHDGFRATCPKPRTVLLMTYDMNEVDGFDQVDGIELEEFLTRAHEFSMPFENVNFKVDGSKHDLLLTTQPLNALQLWLYYKEKKQYPSVSDKAYLAKSCYYFRARSAQECIDHIVAGGYFCVREYTCIIDQSSTDVLNQNFLRILSIGPLMLQARNLGFESAVLSGFVVLLDILNYFANQVWKFIREWLITSIKYFFNVFPQAVRLECIGILSSATEKFRYSDDSRNKIYRTEVGNFVIDFNQSMFIPEDCEVTALYEGGMVPQAYCDSLPVTGTNSYSISGQRFHVEHEFCVNDRNFPVCNLYIHWTTREFRRRMGQRTLVYHVHKFLSKLEEVGLYPVVSCSGTKLTVCNPLDMIENTRFRGVSVVHLRKPSVFTIT